MLSWRNSVSYSANHRSLYMSHCCIVGKTQKISEAEHEEWDLHSSPQS
jgi:hypothetical protein